MDAEISPFTESETGPAAELLVSIFNREPWNDEWTKETAATRLSDLLETPGGMGFVARKDGTVCGFIVGHRKQWDAGEQFYLEEMGVKPELQRSGIGSQLMDRLKAALRDRGIEQIHLLTAKDSPAFSFYEQHGFETHTALRLQYLEL